MNKIRYDSTNLDFTPTQPSQSAKKIPAYAGKALLADGQLLYESGQDPQGKDVARTYSTLRTFRDLTVDDSHVTSRATSQFIITGNITPIGIAEQLKTAKAHLIALCANDFAELKLRLQFNGTDAAILTDARLTAVETAAVTA